MNDVELQYLELKDSHYGDDYELGMDVHDAVCGITPQYCQQDWE